MSAEAYGRGALLPPPYPYFCLRFHTTAVAELGRRLKTLLVFLSTTTLRVSPCFPSFVRPSNFPVDQGSSETLVLFPIVNSNSNPGPIPQELLQLPALRNLNLENNKLKGK